MRQKKNTAPEYCPTCNALQECLRPGELNAIVPAKGYNQLRHSHKELLAALEKCRTELENEIKEIGGCDHSVGMCCCPMRYALDDADAAIAKAKEIK